MGMEENIRNREPGEKTGVCSTIQVKKAAQAQQQEQALCTMSMHSHPCILTIMKNET
jgi:hypothetical protein